MASSADLLGYDELPYPCAPYPYTHPDRLAMVARLFGLSSAPVAGCRVLEVGCGDGSNLIPMAMTLPESRFVGIDTSSRQIAAGAEVIAQLGLNNIELRQQDLAKFAEEGSAFDYIIAQGVFSWTSREVQERLLALCRVSLAEQGVAFVSYNTLPGWRRRQAIRQWLMRATKGRPTLSSRMERVRARLTAMRDALAGRNEPVLAPLAKELEQLASWNDGYLRHDLLEDSNEPTYFSDFVDRASAHGLRFFAESDVATMVGADLPQDVAVKVERLAGSLVEREQLLDLLTNRAFRQSLLCHGEQAPREQLQTSAIEGSYVASMLRPESAAEGARPVHFQARGGFRLAVAEPLAAQALSILAGRWPRGAWFAELVAAANDQLRATGAAIEDPARLDDAAAQLSALLLAGFLERCVELHVDPPPFSYPPSPRPLASPLARLQASGGALVTNLRHDLVQLRPEERQLIQRLDGTHDWHSLLKVMDGGASGPIDTECHRATLERLARQALLWR